LSCILIHTNIGGNVDKYIPKNLILTKCQSLCRDGTIPLWVFFSHYLPLSPIFFSKLLT
jgi:hypothetical protein